MDLPHLLSTPRARKLYISNERHMVSLQSTDFFPTEVISDLLPQSLESRRKYSLFKYTENKTVCSLCMDYWPKS